MKKINKLTYQQLNNKVNQLANFLSQKGVKKGTLVGILINRSVDLIISLLAVIKTGGTYLPLDINNPVNRLVFMLQDSQADFLITQNNLEQLFKDNYNGQIINLDLEWSKINNESCQNLSYKKRDNSLLYVIYTSGSTGQPKGVEVFHRGFNNLLCSLLYSKQKKLNISNQDNWLTQISIAFDMSKMEIFFPLVNGATLFITSETLKNNPGELIEKIEKKKITVMQATPTTWKMLLDYNWNGKKDLSILCGGEKVEFHLVNQLIAKSKNLWNGYGPTEITIYASEKKIENVQEPITIGRPIANTTFYVLNKQMQPVPIGAPGELHIGGVGLAKGYRNNPKLTKEKFIKSPFSNSLSDRLYKTGDLVRYLPNGELEFLGRIDNQVKIRGYRIELGEIETLLNNCNDISQAVVIVREDKVNDKRLVAYFTGGANSTDLNDYLKSKLPKYMVPSAYVRLDKIPITPNGKIDRKSLPRPEKVDFVEYVAPKSKTEKKLVTIWEEILGLKKISVNSNFFDLGGHSLLAIQLSYRINSTFNVEMPIYKLFELSTLRELSQYIENSSKKSSLNLPKIVTDEKNRHSKFPLTDVQQAYWLGRSGDFELSDVAVHRYVEYEEEHLDINRLEKAWNILIKRHEALRLIFPGNGFQSILKNTPYYKFKTLNLQSNDEETTQQQLEQIKAELIYQIFPAEKWPLFEIRVTQLKNKVRLHLSCDVLILDAWSFGVIFKEWGQLYNDLNHKLSHLNLSFRDYVLAEQKLKQDSVYKQHKKYWLNRLNDFPLAPMLPLKQSPEKLKKQVFKRHQYSIDKSIWDNVKSITNRQCISPTSLLLSIFAEVLALWSKDTHFALNLTLFNRLPIHSQINEIAGDFTSLTLLEVDCTKDFSNGNDTFLFRTKKLQKQLWKDIDNGFFSGVEVIRELLRRQNNINTKSIMPIVFTSALGTDMEGGFLSNEVFGSHQTPQVWLDNQVYERNGDLIVIWDYVDGLFPNGFLKLMHSTFCKTIENFEELNWEKTNFNFLPKKQLSTRQKINGTNWTPTFYPLHELLDRQAVKTPDKTAIICGKNQINYLDLQNKSNQLAHYLCNLGAKRNKLIAIVMSKSVDQVIACLGILKSGSAYLPIDPNLPSNRIEELLSSGEVISIVTQKEYKKELKKLSYVQKLSKDNLVVLDDSKNCSIETLQKSKLDDLAYVIFTSGSTGMPKGVMISHRSVVNTILDINNKFKINQKDSVLAISNLNFDLSVYDIFGLLAVGGTIIMPEKEKDPKHWMELILKHKITIWNTVPTFMKMLVNFDSDLKNSLNNSLKLVLLSGDWIETSLPAKIRSLFGLKLDLISLGGATEASIWSIYYPIKKESFKKSIPYGKPLCNQRFYVLNKNMEHCPEWVTGDLYIGGIGLAKGYWKDEKKTKRSFITHPVTKESLYKTGDLGRYLSDGNIEFLGREDCQVKIGGHRIELGEIESVLLEHNDIKQAVVIENNQKLIAYINKKGSLGEKKLQNYLEKRLPQYMIPREFVFIKKIPLTSSGKIDRKNLPRTKEKCFVKEEFVVAKNVIEQDLVGIWSDVLNQKLISTEANFFRMGGNSLSAVQVVNRINRHFVIEMSLRKIFEKPTVIELSKEIRQLLYEGGDNNYTQIKQISRKRAIPLSYAQKRLWFLNRLEEHNTVYNNVAFAFKMDGKLKQTVLEKTFNEILCRHEVLRTVFVESDGIPKQKIIKNLKVKINKINIKSTENQKKELEKLIKEDTEKPFDVENGPLWRVSIICLNKTKHVLLISTNHIIFDGWSVNLFINELREIYSAFSIGKEHSLRQISVQYADYTCWHRDFLARNIKHQLSWWKRKLKGAQTTLNLPIDYKRPKKQIYNGDIWEYKLDKKDTNKLKEFAKQHDVTLFMVLFAAFNVFLYRYTEQDDIIVGTPVSGRSHNEIEKLMGCFINTLAIRTNLKRNPTFVSLLKKVKKSALGFYAHQEVPLEKLVNSLNLERSLSHSPLFQVMFNMLEQQGESFTMDDLLVTPMETKRRVSQFDLGLSIQDYGNELTCSFEYNTDLFKAETVQRVARHFQNILDSVLDNPRQKINKIELFDEEEKHRQLVQWNKQKVSYPKGELVHKLFERQAEKTPDAVALIFKGEELTYKELNEKANVLAHSLIDIGVNNEDVIVIGTERSNEFIIAVLGILKAGGVYLPLEPDLPEKRVEMILKDAQPKVIITQSSTETRFSKFRSTLCINNLKQERANNPNISINKENLAYIIYTSGSTGIPKGVEITHEGISDRVVCKAETYPIKPDDIVLLTSSFLFDASILNYFFALCFKIPLVIASKEEILESLTELICQHKITIIGILPSLLRNLLDDEKINFCSSLRNVFAGGEPLSGQLIKQFYKKLNKAKLYNSYGPTEATVDTTVWECKKNFDEEEKHSQLIKWNKAEVSSPKTQFVHELFEEHVEKTPNAIAVIFGEKKLTFKELNDKANCIAKQLSKYGKGIIAIGIDRSSDFIVAVLGILKSGCAYVPIDSDMPVDRIKTILQDTQAKIILTTSDTNEFFAKFGDTLCVDKVEKKQEQNPKINVKNHDLAYVIYTSGSTGEPKGVEITHDSIIDRVQWKQNKYKLSSSDVMLHTYSFVFDGSIINYFWSLCYGVQLVIASKENILGNLSLLIKKYKVTTVDLLPSLIPTFHKEDCLSLKNVFSGGEALSGEIVREFYKNFEAKLYNTYGPTEASVDASVWECEKEFDGDVAPIGKQIAGAKLYVLDKWLNVVPVGVHGELYIGGVGLARGYRNKPELTKKKFVKDPFSDDPKAKMYKTGDLVRYREDGNIEFLGRIDNQVKIRGFRVELGEIEASIRGVKGIKDVVVVFNKETERLVAYVISGKKLSKSIKEKLTTLPDYMIPHDFVQLDSFPTLPSGKVDSKALPAANLRQEKKVSQPKNLIEKQLLFIWQELLSYKNISIEDNFFDIGGHSLLAVRLIARIKTILGVSLPLAALFQNSTIKSLAVEVKNCESRVWSPLVPIKSEGHGKPFFCVHPVGGNVLCYRDLAKVCERPFYGLQERGLEDGQTPHKTISDMAKEYVRAIKQRQPKGPYFIGGWSFGGLIAAEMAYQLEQMGEEVERLILIDTGTKVDKFKAVDVNNEARLLSELSRHLKVKLNKRKKQSNKELLAKLIEHGKRSEEVSKDYANKLTELAKANYRALQTFELKPVNCDVLLVKAGNQKENDDLGWGKYTQSLEVIQVKGDHWTMIQEPFVKDVVAHLQQYQPLLLKKRR